MLDVNQEAALKHYKHRDNCRLCLSHNVELTVPFKPVPIAEKYVSSVPKEPTPLFPVDLYMCMDCGHVQILDVISPDYLWADYTYHSAQTRGIVEHFNQVTENLLKNQVLSENRFVIDVGSNDGSLLRCFKERGYRVLGIDPATEIAAAATASGIETLPELMAQKKGKIIAKEYGKAGIVTAFNVFAHADEMIDLLQGIVEVLAEDGIFMFEVSYLKDIVEKMLVGTIFHEHLCNHSLFPLKLFLENNGLELVDVEHVSIQGGSLIGYAQHKGSIRSISNNVVKMLAEEEAIGLHKRKAMDEFNQRLYSMKLQVHKILNENLQNLEIVAGYGAARSGPMLLTQFDLNQHVEMIFDDHPQKVGMLTPGDNIKVYPTTELSDVQPRIVVILAWIHAKKIIQKHLDYLENGGAFLTLTPEVKLINKDNVHEFL